MEVQLENPEFFEEIFQCAESVRQTRENLTAHHMGEKNIPLQVQPSRARDSPRRQSSNFSQTLNHKTGLIPFPLEGSSVHLQKKPPHTPITPESTNLMDFSMDALKEIETYIKNTHIKMLTYSIGRDLTDKQIDAYHASHPTNDSPNLSANNQIRIRQCMGSSKIKLDRMFEFVTKFIDTADLTKQSEKRTAMLEDYNLIYIRSNAATTEMSHKNNGLKKTIDDTEDLMKTTRAVSFLKKNNYEGEIMDLGEKVQFLVSELQRTKRCAVQLNSDIEKKDVIIDNLRMKSMGTSIVETKLGHMGNRFFTQVGFLMSKYTEIVGHLDLTCDKLKNQWMKICKDVKDPLVQKNNFEFINFFKSLRDIVEDYDFNKNKVNLDIYKNFIGDYDLKKRTLDAEIEKKRSQTFRVIDTAKAENLESIRNDKDSIFRPMMVSPTLTQSPSRSAKKNLKKSFCQ